MGDALEERGLHLCAGMQKGETGSKRMSGGGANGSRDSGAPPRRGKDGDRRGMDRNQRCTSQQLCA